MVDGRIIEMLSKLRPEDDPLSSIEIADILWLATQRRRRQKLTEPITPEPPSKAPPKDSGKAPEDSQPDPKPLNLEPENDPEPDPPPAVPVVPSTPAPQPAPAKALPFAVPAARALPQARLIARALRPLRQKVNSRTQQVIDIPATIYRLAEEKILIPELKPAQESWFDVVLVVEKTSAYGIWAPTINEFEQLLLHQGGLRDARRWYAEPQADGTLRLHSRQGKTRAVKELIQSGSQRLIFIFSDCVDPTWRNGAWQELCEMWGQHHAVVVMQLLPTAFWRRTQLHHLSKAWQRSDRVNPLNRQWQFSDYSGLEDDFETPQGFPAPVLPLEPYPLSIWAQGMLGRSPVDLTGYFLKKSVPIAPTTSDAPPPTAQTRFNNFCKMASAPAQRLAALMSAVPVQLPIARLIQQTILKAEANPTQIAEIFLSGIVQRRGNADDPNKQLYDFYADDQADIRALLNQTLPAREIATIIDCLSADLARRAGKSIQEFQALLMAPAPAGVDSELAAEIGEFARVTLAVLKGLGGDYRAFAEALEGGEPDSEEEPQEIELIPYDYEAVSLKVSSWETGTFTFVVGKVVKKRNGWRVDQEQGQAPGLTQWLTEEVKLELMSIPAGNFVMGAPETEKESSDDERPQQLITLKSFYLGRFPITQGQWRVVAGWEPVEHALEAEPSHFKEDFEVSDDRWQRPVEGVSWFDAVEFCARLSRETGLIYRLPTEAEWEYACRGIKREQLLGLKLAAVEKWLTGESALSERERAEVIRQWNRHYVQPFHFGPTLTDQVANYDATYTYNNGPKGEYREQTIPVGYFECSNPFGLSDLHGNVSEWCLDDYHSSLAEMSADDQSRQPLEQDNIFIAVLRSGSWRDGSRRCRSAYRSYYDPASPHSRIGFRVLCEGPRT